MEGGNAGLKYILMVLCFGTGVTVVAQTPPGLNEQEASEIAMRSRAEVIEQRESFPPDLAWKGVDAKKLSKHLLAIEGKVHGNSLIKGDPDLVAFEVFFNGDASDVQKAVYAARLPLASATLPVVLEVIDKVKDERLKQRILVSLGVRSKKMPEGDRKVIVEYLTNLLVRNPTSEPIVRGVLLSLSEIDERASVEGFTRLVLVARAKGSPVGRSSLMYLKRNKIEIYKSIVELLKVQGVDILAEIERSRGGPDNAGKILNPIQEAASQ